MEYTKTKDGLTINIVTRAGEYQENAKKYVVNMCSGKKMLHIKNGCHYSKSLWEYISFDTLEEVDNLPFTVSHCQYCFPNQKNK